jgi:hypothetical protein
MVPEEVGRDWRVAFGGTATRCESAADVVGGDGESVAVDVELVTRARHEPFLYSGGADWPGGEDEDRYEVATRVEGVATDGEWLWISGSFEDGSAYNHLSAWPAGYGPSEMDPAITNGFWFDGETVHAITAADLSADPPFGEETGSEWMEAGAAPTIDLTLEWDGGSTALAVEPGATTPVDWEDEDTGHRAVLNRSPSVQTRDGEVDGRGWLENMTQLPE